jgi:hypothetical protein
MEDLQKLSIEALADLRDRASAILADKVAARQKELQDEAARIGG